jgi:hypothetical protein
MISALDQYARAIALARGAIRPPPGLDVDLAAWQALADRLGARLCVGDLSMVGTLDTTRVDLGLVFDESGSPAFMRVRVGDPKQATERARETTLSIAAPSAAATSATTNARIASLLATWPADVVDLELANGVAAAGIAAKAAVDPTRVRELIRALQALLASLDEPTGPYR